MIVSTDRNSLTSAFLAPNHLSTPKLSTHLYRCSLQTVCAAQPQPSTPEPSQLPRTTSFPTPHFLTTPLRRIPLHLLPNDIDQTLQLPAMFLPLAVDRPILNNISPGLAEPVFWTASQTRAHLQTHPNTLIIPLSYSEHPLVYYFAMSIPSDSSHILHSQTVTPIRSAIHLLSETHANLVAHAKSIIAWHLSFKFCPRCATPLTVRKSGLSRQCPNNTCFTRNIYPTIMPSILVAVTNYQNDAILLAKKESWKPGRYSVLAGFAEVFESLEQTVVREVFEETGIHVDPKSIVYRASQPWPSSPHASVMSGFRARAQQDGKRIVLDRNELQDAQWFTKFRLNEGLRSHDISIPGKTSMANHLIMEWLEEEE